MPKVSGKPFHFPNILFGKIYNLFSANFSKFKYIIGGKSKEYSKKKTLRINSVGTGRGGRGIFGGRGEFGGHGGHSRGGCRRVQYRGSPYTPYLSPYVNINIKIESRQYPK